GGAVAEGVARRTRAEGSVELGEIGTASRDRGQGSDRHEGEWNARRPSRRAALTDVLRRERERRGDGGIVRRRAGLGWQLRDGEARAAAATRRFDRASHRADAFL